jgi:hypothetical protein
MAMGIDRQVQLAPAPTTTFPVFLPLPLTRSLNFQPR